MTAEVAILNNQGVAIAADSAVTIGLNSGEKKIYYTAEKIFKISDKHPIGVMIYSQADFMGINWKILIHEFSKQLGEKVFDTLEEYLDQLISFLSEFKFIPVEKHIEYLGYICFRTFSMVKEYYEKEIAENNDSEKLKQDKIKILSDSIKKRNEELEKSSLVFHDFSGKFIKANSEFINDFAKKVFNDIHLSDKILDELMKLVILDVQKLDSNGLFKYSGIVMVGYGEREIFPSVCSSKIFGRLGDDLVHELIDSSHITDEGQAMVYPFAQTDVINTFIRGIDDDLQMHITKLFFDILKNNIGLDNDSVGKLTEFFLENINKIKTDNYRDPILNIVASLPNINLAEMAQALINITSLRRHVSTDSETVGGPTDVAIISKIDGFVWVKRKDNLSI